MLADFSFQLDQYTELLNQSSIVDLIKLATKYLDY